MPEPHLANGEKSRVKHGLLRCLSHAVRGSRVSFIFI